MTMNQFDKASSPKEYGNFEDGDIFIVNLETSLFQVHGFCWIKWGEMSKKTSTSIFYSF